MAATPKREDNRDLNETLAFETKTEMTNYILIRKLSTKFIAYIATAKIPVPEQLMQLLTNADDGEKLGFIKTYLSPRAAELPMWLQAQATSQKIVLSAENLDMCGRYLSAMIEVADKS